MRYLLTVLLFTSAMFGQGATFQGPKIESQVPQPIPGLTINVCLSGASGTPCTPSVTVYSNQTLTTPVTSLKTDGDGQIPTFYIAPGSYQWCASDPIQGRITSYCTPFTVAATGGGPGAFTTLTAATVTVTGALKAQQDSNGCYTVGTPGAANVQAAITLAGTTGCVTVPNYYSGIDTYTNPNGIPVIDYRPIGGVGAIMFGGNSFYLNSLVRCGPSLDGSGRLIPLGNDCFIDARGAADLILQQERTQATSTTSVGGAGTQNITVGATANFYLGAGITIERYGANEETIASGAWSITNGTTINATFTKAHTQPYAVDQWGALDIKGWLIRWFDQESGTQINQWKQLRSGASRGFALQDASGNNIFHYMAGDGLLTVDMPLLGVGGSKAVPMYGFGNGYGTYVRAGVVIEHAINGSALWQLSGSGNVLGNNLTSCISSGQVDSVLPDTCFTRLAAGLAGIGTTNGSPNKGALVQSGNTVRLTADFTDANSTALQTITGLSWTLPAFANSYNFHCSLSYSQATGAVADAFGIQGATTAPTNLVANGLVYTAAGTSTSNTSGNVTNTTATNVVTFTPSASATVFTAQLDGQIEVGASGSTLNIMVSQTTGANVITIKRGSYCQLF